MEKESFKALPAGWEGRFCINEHYRFLGKEGKFEFAGRRYKEKHWDLRLERENGKVNFSIWLYFDAGDLPKAKTRHVVRKPQKSLFSVIIELAKLPTKGEFLRILPREDHPIEFLFYRMPFLTPEGNLIVTVDSGKFVVLNQSPLVFKLDGRKFKNEGKN
jgi:hypothetical protein